MRYLRRVSTDARAETKSPVPSRYAEASQTSLQVKKFVKVNKGAIRSSITYFKPEGIKPKSDVEKFPRGWALKARYIHIDGRVFEKGKETGEVVTPEEPKPKKEKKVTEKKVTKKKTPKRRK